MKRNDYIKPDDLLSPRLLLFSFYINTRFIVLRTTISPYQKKHRLLQPIMQLAYIIIAVAPCLAAAAQGTLPFYAGKNWYVQSSIIVTPLMRTSTKINSSKDQVGSASGKQDGKNENFR